MQDGLLFRAERLGKPEKMWQEGRERGQWGWEWFIDFLGKKTEAFFNVLEGAESGFWYGFWTLRGMKILTRITALLLLFACVASLPARAQSKDEATVKRLVDSRRFIFVAQTMFPMAGPSRNITSDYDMQITPDSVTTYLPYFGRAYAPILPGEGGINFTSSKFSYETRPGKKGGWDIEIQPRDTKDVRQLNLHVNKNGYATLQVTSGNRQAISYYGYLDEKR